MSDTEKDELEAIIGELSERLDRGGEYACDTEQLTSMARIAREDAESFVERIRLVAPRDEHAASSTESEDYWRGYEQGNKNAASSGVLQAVLDAIKGTLDTSTQIVDHPNVKFAQMERLKLLQVATEGRAPWQAIRAKVEQPDSTRAQELELDITSALNKFSQENASNTPDFILAQFLLGCLAAWDSAVQHREVWYGRDVYGRDVRHGVIATLPAAGPGSAGDGWPDLPDA